MIKLSLRLSLVLLLSMMMLLACKTTKESQSSNSQLEQTTKSEIPEDPFGGIQYYTKQIQKDSTNYDAWYQRALVRVSLGKWDVAKTDFDMSIQQNEATNERTRQADSLLSRAYNERSFAHYSLANTKAAIEDAEEAIQIDSTNLYAFNNLGFFKMKMEDYEGAIETLDMVLSQPAPPLIVAYAVNNRGFAHHKLGRHDEALRDIEESLGIEVRNPYAYYNRALVFLELKLTRAACVNIEKAMKLGLQGDELKKASSIQMDYCN